MTYPFKTCPTCGGTGNDPNITEGNRTCGTCGGEGYIDK